MTTEARAATEGVDEEDRLPWLEAVEEDERGPSPGKLIAAVLVGLVAIGIIVGGLFWLGNRAAGGGEEELIASSGEYKVPAPEPGGMKVDNGSSAQVAASEGTEQTSSVNPNARPEAPVNQPPQPAPQAQPQAQPQGQQQAQAQRPQPQPQAQPQQAQLSGPTIQVGAYPSAAAANGEWARLTQRYPYLRGLQHAVMTHQRGGQTFYRLRAAGNDASGVCRRLRSAGQPCMDVK
jgi:type IV secretory pathway VirB10-like protein